MILTFKSIRFKLILWYFIVLTIILATFSLLLYFSYSYSLYSRIDGSLQSRAEAVASLIDLQRPELILHFKVTGNPRILNLDQIGINLPSTSNLSPFIDKANIYGQFIQIFSIKGEALEKSSNLRNINFHLTGEALNKALNGQISFQTIYLSQNIPIRILVYPVKDPQGKVIYIIQVGTLLSELQNSLEKLFLGLLITVPATLILALLGGFIMAGKVLRPIGEINLTAKKISAENLTQRLTISNPDDEIGKLQITLNEMFDRLENAFAIQRRFTADASHELRTPLTVLKGEIEVTLKRDRIIEEYKEVLQSCLEEVDRLTNIVKDLLFLARSDEGKTALNLKNVRLDLLCEDILKHLSLMAKEKKVKLESHIEENVEIYGDGDRLKQLLFNLLDNGIKYNREYGRLNLTLKNKDNYVEIQIADSGIGISEENISHIFERFYRVDKARSREAGGSGLGLSIVKWIIDLHRGTIEVKSEINEGSIFIIKLPQNYSLGNNSPSEQNE